MILFNPLVGVIRRYNTFPKGISPKVNVIEQLDFELNYFNTAVQHFSHNTMDTPCCVMVIIIGSGLLWHINHCWLFNAKSCFYMNIKFASTFCRYTKLNDQTVLFLTIQFNCFQVLLCITNNSMKHQSFVSELNDQIVLFQTIQFSISQQS